MVEIPQFMHSVGDIEQVSNGYAITIFDSDETPGLTFVYASRDHAQRAAKMMQAALQDATTVLLAG